MDVAYLIKGKVKSHHGEKLGIIIVAIVEVKENAVSPGESRSRGAKFAYVLPGDTEITEDLIRALDFARTHQDYMPRDRQALTLLL